MNLYFRFIYNFSQNNLNVLSLSSQILPDYKENLLKLSMDLLSIIITNSRNTCDDFANLLNCEIEMMVGEILQSCEARHHTCMTAPS